MLPYSYMETVINIFSETEPRKNASPLACLLKIFPTFPSPNHKILNCSHPYICFYSYGAQIAILRLRPKRSSKLYHPDTMVTQSPLRHYKQINKIKFLKSHLGLQGEPLLQRTTCIFSTNLLRSLDTRNG